VQRIGSVLTRSTQATCQGATAPSRLTGIGK